MNAIRLQQSAPERLLAAARDAQSHRERFEQSDAPGELDAAIAGWNALLTDPDLARLPSDFRASVMNETAMALNLRFRAAGHESDRVRALQLCQDAVATTTLDSPNRCKRLNNLSACLSREYDYSHRPEDLDGAAKCLLSALDVAPFGWLGRGVTLYNLGNIELTLHAARQDVHFLDDAVEHFREAMTLAAPGTAERVAVLDALTLALDELYQRTRQEEQLKEMVDASQEALRTAVEPPPRRAFRLAVLGANLYEFYQRSGQLAKLDAAIACLRHSIEIEPNPLDLSAGGELSVESPLRFVDKPHVLSGHEDAWRLHVLGGLLFNRYKAWSRPEDLEEAINLLLQAAGSPAKDAISRAGQSAELANALLARYERDGKAEDLEKALGFYRGALALMAEPSEERGQLLDSLADGLAVSYCHTGQLDVLNQAIDLRRKALLMLPPGATGRKRLLNNLATDLRDRYFRTGELEDLDEALSNWEEAVNVESDDSAQHASILCNWGVGLRARYARSGSSEDLDTAVSLLEKGLALMPPESVERPGRLSSLGNVLADRYAARHAVGDLKKSVAAYRQSVTSTPVTAMDWPGLVSNLGMGLRDLYRHTHQAKLLDEAIELFRKSLDASSPDSSERAAALLNLGSSLRTRYKDKDRNAPEDLSEAIAAYEKAVTCTAGGPEVVIIASKTWSQWALERGSFAEAARAAEYGLDQEEKLLKAQYRRRQQEDWLFAAQGVAENAAYAWAHAGDLQRAVEILEASRAHLLSEALERNRHDLDRLAQLGHRELLNQYRKTSAEWEALTAPAGDERARAAGGACHPAATREQLDACRSRLDAVLDAIRRVPGYADFLSAPSFAQIQAAATPAPLVYVAVTRVGGMALVVRGAQLQPTSPVDIVSLPSLTDMALLEQLFGTDGSGGYLGAYARRVPGTLTFMRWMNALDGITEWLWQNIMEPIVGAIQKENSVPPATLIPSGLLGLLPLHAAWRPDSSAPSGRRYALDDVNWSYAPNARALAAARERAAVLSADKLLLVVDPQPVKAADLPNALEEADKIIQLWPEAARTSLPQRAATYEEVTRKLPLHDVLHYAGHAFAGWDMPQEGGLLLADDRVLTVRELHTMHLTMRLAVLSACETGVPGARIPDEVIGLPTGLVEAGVIGVVASLWSVPDATTAQLMGDFYALWRSPELELLARPGEALRCAQLALRDGGHAHPYFWAAFAYSGV